jgi:hypothetical protein|tara:strand:- start:468 stop:791 length:324 start_codon:yes stop_codon:yes gene_type:complete
MSILDNAKKHFQSKEVKTIEVKEWNTTFIVKPMTLDEQRRLLEKSEKNQVEAMVDLIIMKCLQEDGKTPAFKLSDKQDLLKEVDPNIMTEIVNKIGSESSVQIEKKS